MGLGSKLEKAGKGEPAPRRTTSGPSCRPASPAPPGCSLPCITCQKAPAHPSGPDLLLPAHSPAPHQKDNCWGEPGDPTRHLLLPSLGEGRGGSENAKGHTALCPPMSAGWTHLPRSMFQSSAQLPLQTLQRRNDSSTQDQAWPRGFHMTSPSRGVTCALGPWVPSASIPTLPCPLSSLLISTELGRVSPLHPMLCAQESHSSGPEGASDPHGVTGLQCAPEDWRPHPPDPTQASRDATRLHP